LQQVLRFFRSIESGDRKMSEVHTLHDVAVVGSGPSGLVTALALAEVGAEVVAIGPVPAPGPRAVETRTAALLTSSIDLLKSLGVWERLACHAAPLTAIRIIDASRSLLRAPDIEFKASELGLAAFGYNIANTALTDALYARAQERLPAVIPASVSNIVLGAGNVVLSVADGRRSICRTSAGIGVSERRYDQGAIATSFSHSLPHTDVSTELHKEAGSVTTVPLLDPHASSLIWVGPSAEIAALMQLAGERFGDALSERLGGLLGAIDTVGARTEFPVAGLTADRLAAKRIVLVGEAAHILPPIGAQGLNLGFRDAAALADCVAEALARRGDPGGDNVLEAYTRARRLDIMTRTFGVDLMSRALLTSLGPLQAARGIVLHGLKSLPPLRRAVMRVGLSPPTELPSLMRPTSG
jgi:2-octaprenyl-6-methoxyphenol hydroxylase